MSELAPAAPAPTASHTLPVGALLRDYRVERVLGQGGFGVVYLAEDVGLGRRVAIKEYLPTGMASRGADGRSVVLVSDTHTETFTLGLRSFVNEARLLARFKHPSLVEVHQFWEDAGTAYMVMPYYEGPTLQRVLRELGRRPTEAEMRGWLMPLLDALEVLHRDHVYHRDIAPDNVLLTAHGPLLLDFGAARRVIGDATQALTAVLKPGYAPVEQYGQTPGLDQGPWTDVFALASVLYVAATGARPVPAVERVFNDRLVPLAQLAPAFPPPGLSPGFVAAVDAGMAVRPEMRPQSIAAFRALLQGGGPATVEPEAPPVTPGLEATRIVGGAAPMRATPPQLPQLPQQPAPQATAMPLTEMPRTHARAQHNLPLQRTSFVGRETEVAEVQALLDEAPLVTVLGMGGLGKTRLTLRVAAERLPQLRDGAWFVDLSAVTDPAQVPGAVARALDIHDEPGRPLLDTLCAWLQPRQLLLVLDNCEHMVAAAADLADAVLSQAAEVRVLASSRERLDVVGEQSYPIAPLAVPERGAEPEAVFAAPAVRLFGERARAQRPGFVLDEQDPALLADLLARLEGIPLAIELAAARLRTLSLPELLAGLDDRYGLLTGGSRQLQKRQQTLRALVDWSYDMLDERERLLFARLSVFAGGFDTAAVQAVCAEPGEPPLRLVDRLGSLVQKSLVLLGDGSRGGRYGLLETLRDYAREKLAEFDPEGATAARHAQHYFALAKEAARGMRGAEQGRWMRRLDLELQNLRGAAALALAGGVDPLIAVKMAVALVNYWIVRGHPSEGRQLIGAAMARPEVQGSELARAWALFTSATLAGAQGDHISAIGDFEACLALRRGLGQPLEIAATLSALALAQLQAGDPDAAAAAEREALQLFTQQAEALGQAISWLHLAQIELWAGRAEQALAQLEPALGLARGLANPEIEAEAELTRAQALALQDDTATARSAAERALALSQESGDKRGEYGARGWLGRLALEAGDAAAARGPLRQALAGFMAQEMRPQLCAALDDLALLRAAEGTPVGALELAAAADQARRRFLLLRSRPDEGRWERALQAMRAALSLDEAEGAEQRGRQWGLDQAVKAARERAAA